MKNLKLSNILFLTLIVCAIFSCSNQETEIESVESKDMVQPDFLKKVVPIILYLNYTKF